MDKKKAQKPVKIMDVTVYEQSRETKLLLTSTNIYVLIFPLYSLFYVKILLNYRWATMPQSRVFSLE